MSGQVKARVGGHGDGGEGVHAQARCQREGVLGPGSHKDGEDACHEGGGGRNGRGTEGGAGGIGAGEDQGIQDHDGDPAFSLSL